MLKNQIRILDFFTIQRTKNIWIGKVIQALEVNSLVRHGSHITDCFICLYIKNTNYCKGFYSQRNRCFHFNTLNAVEKFKIRKG